MMNGQPPCLVRQNIALFGLLHNIKKCQYYIFKINRMFVNMRRNIYVLLGEQHILCIYFYILRTSQRSNQYVALWDPECTQFQCYLRPSPRDLRTLMHFNVVLTVFHIDHISQGVCKTVRTTFQCIIVL